MYVLVHYSVTDPLAWEHDTRRIEEIIAQGVLPKGLKCLMLLPCADGEHVVGVWETPSVLALRSFLDRETGMAAINEYCEVKEDQAFGLPAKEMLRQAA